MRHQQALDPVEFDKKEQLSVYDENEDIDDEEVHKNDTITELLMGNEAGFEGAQKASEASRPTDIRFSQQIQQPQLFRGRAVKHTQQKTQPKHAHAQPVFKAKRRSSQLEKISSQKYLQQKTKPKLNKNTT